MTNTLANYDITFAARSALMWLKNKRGIVKAVSRQAEIERQSSWEQGQTVNLRRSTMFSDAEDHVAGTGTTAEDIKGQNVSITLSNHKEKKFTITDRELAYGTQRLIDEHIGPAVDRVADSIENAIYALGANIGPWALANQSGAANIIAASRKVLLANKTPMDPDKLFCAVDPSLEQTFITDAIWNSANNTGQGGNQTLIDASLGRRFGINFFSSQLAIRNIAQEAETLAAAAGTGDRVGAVKTAADVNASQVVLKGLTDTQTIATTNDTLTFAGDPTVYRVTAVSGAVTSNEVTVTLFPALRKNVAVDQVATFGLRETIQDAAAGTKENLMFHRDALALVMAPLPAVGDGMGARIASVVDEQTGLSLRLRMWYEGGPSKINVAVDALFGVQVLDGQLACRMLRAQS
jgi:hypothetical protein